LTLTYSIRGGHDYLWYVDENKS